MKRGIKGTYKAEKVNMGGIIIDQPLPNNSINQIDPFLLLHHWRSRLQGGQLQKEVGVGPHPHRGFSPVTVVFEGAVHHRDSFGNDSVVGKGGVQWMHAGKGITHSERPSKELAEEGGVFEIIQFWVNSPAASKMNPPQYIPLQKEDILTHQLAEGVNMQVIAGEYEGIKSTTPILSPMLIARIDANDGSSFILDLPESYNVALYHLDGSLTVNDVNGSLGKTLFQFENEKAEIQINVEKKSRILLLAGEPLNEEVKSYGPFVMNNTTEVMQAIRDAQVGKMGILIEEF